MFGSRFRVIGVLAAAAMLVGACSSSAASPTPAPTPTPTAAPTEAASAPASVAPTAAPLPTIPANELITAGTLTICSDLPYPPQEYYDTDGTTAIGSDIDIATEIAKRLGVKLSVKPTVFKTIIPALTGGACDAIVSAQTITAERQGQVDMVPYFEAGQSFVVLKGNPSNLKTTDDLCGKTIAAENGTVEADHLNGTGDYKPAEGLSAICQAKGKDKITVQLFDKDSDALLAMQAGTVVAHFTDEPVAGYEVKQGNGQYEVAPALTLEHAPEGISITKNHPELRDAIKAALKSMIADGTYDQILTKWGVQSGKLSTPLN